MHVCWHCASLHVSAIPAGRVSHYQPCLLVWCFIIGHAFWFGTSLNNQPCLLVWFLTRSCLLVWCLTIGHACWHGTSLSISHAWWSVLHFNWHFDWLSADGREMATRLVLLLQNCHYIRHVCWSGTTLRYACLYSATLSDMYAGLNYSDTRVCKVLLHQARNLVCYKSTRYAYRLGTAPTGL